jgi:hypothetical protein
LRKFRRKPMVTSEIKNFKIATSWIANIRISGIFIFDFIDIESQEVCILVHLDDVK